MIRDCSWFFENKKNKSALPYFLDLHFNLFFKNKFFPEHSVNNQINFFLVNIINDQKYLFTKQLLASSVFNDFVLTNKHKTKHFKFSDYVKFEYLSNKDSFDGDIDDYIRYKFTYDFGNRDINHLISNNLFNYVNEYGLSNLSFFIILKSIYPDFMMQHKLRYYSRKFLFQLGFYILICNYKIYRYTPTPKERIFFSEFLNHKIKSIIGIFKRPVSNNYDPTKIYMSDTFELVSIQGIKKSLNDK